MRTMDEGLKTDPCGVCRGTGHTYLEHADGSLSEEVCPYCHGAQNSTWRHDAWAGRNSRLAGIKGIIWGYLALYVLTFGGHVWAHSAGFKLAHILLALPILVGLVWIWVHPGPRRRPKRPPNPLTTNQERLMGGAVLGGAVLKTQLQQRFPRR